MIALDFGLGGFEADIWRVVFLMTRVGAALLAAPFFGASNVPVVVRISFTGAMAIFISIWLPEVATPPALLTLDGMLALAGEALIGLMLGFVLQIAFAAPTIAAEVIGGSMGLSMATTTDPNGGGSTTAFGQYFIIVLTLIFLATNAHLHWLALVTESYRAFPPGQTWIGPERFETIFMFGGTLFETALRIALPVTLILLLVQIVTGILSRSAPSLNLFALGLPAGVLAGIAALIIAAPLIYDQFTDLVQVALAQAESVMAS
ncbi:flagellar biosynthetic protein FliR [Citromicrobium bathyomarinum]|jgi:flagellar biosynthesis protein FliR|uniref:flagellar biosynthetic protein FliR n=1 Tax=Sphingomonadales TaxID=204457 RepID=UPI0001DD0CC5|nr:MULTISPECIES: flagellar biosynthetic protein FliR [Sphingomonadales]MAY76595.1 flagellar biosynthetic protein FliR [Citromicrobium sp.]ALG59433.1 flagellar biosynthesis protein FliR [Citromicrobium sp. JL477]KPM16135.1 flagellar biosynthesis protein FliR [Citromicrobium sp. JL1351]KPM16789.1 flagellar biosynthesis protein FliR [Citromicrobium sp. WPS32]KPM19402.1 flagellar biosynthesis protein FliR [Citromicrobium sp. JL31]|tara:strand:+ start:1973 stop:2758 length:786 start_codon:yes stop_codon:yes gene_type:complete